MELHPKPKQPIQINRKLIITIAIAVVTVLLLAIVAALTATNRVRTDTTTSLKIATDKTDKLAVSPELQGLPENYSDVDGIKKYSSDLSSSQLALVLQRFNDLQGEYEVLKQQMSNRGPTQDRSFSDPKTQQAKEASMIFPSLGSKVDNMVGAQDDKNRPFQSLDDKDNLVPTPQQEEFFRKKAQDTQKLAVMKGKDNPEDIYDLHNIIKPASKYQVLAGTLIPAALITGIDSTHEGTLVAQVQKNIYDTVTGKYLLIPKGSKLLGEYSTRISAGQNRVLLGFNRVIRPDGSSILLGKTLGVDAIGQSGVEGNVNNHWARILGAATISTILGVGAGVAGDKFNNGTQNPNSKQQAFGGAASSITQFGQSIANRDINIPPTITVAPGLQFNLAVKRDMVLNPYKPKNY